MNWLLMSYTPITELETGAIADNLSALEHGNEFGFSCTDRESYEKSVVQRLCDLGLARGRAVSRSDGPGQMAVNYVGPIPRSV